MVNEVPFKFIVDSGPPDTLVSNCLFNNKSQVEPLITTYRDVNNQKIEFIGQTQATVKTINKTIKQPLLITKAATTPLKEGAQIIQQKNRTMPIYLQEQVPKN